VRPKRSHYGELSREPKLADKTTHLFHRGVVMSMHCERFMVFAIPVLVTACGSSFTPVEPPHAPPTTGAAQVSAGATDLVSAREVATTSSALPMQPVGKHGARRDGNLIMVTYWGQDSVGVVDIDAAREIATIETCLKPYDVKVDGAGRFAYVSCSGSADISVIDIQAMLEAARISVGESPRDIALTADGKRLVTANSGSDNISVVDVEKRQEIYSVPVGAVPYGVALAENDRLAAVTCWGSNEFVAVILDENAGKVRGRVPVGALPYTVGVPTNGAFAVITNFGANQVTTVDLRSLKVVDRIPVGRSPWGLSLSDDGTRAFVANFYSGDISFIDLDSTSAGRNNRERTRMSLNLASNWASPRNAERTMAFAPSATSIVRAKNLSVSNDGSKAVLTDLGKNEVLIIDVPSEKVLSAVPVGKAPYGIAFIPRGS
jgi:YVTN family beta-propeller protein